jgi:hypothetical protein
LSWHDKLYTTLLGVLAFFIVMGFLTLLPLYTRAGSDEASRFALKLSMGIAGGYFFVCVAGLLIRIIAPAYRKFPTLGLNIILATYVPFGTALAIYGFMKVDKTP